MVSEVNASGLLKISNEADRVSVASILYKNGYAVTPFRAKKNGKSYEYYVRYKMESADVSGGVK